VARFCASCGTEVDETAIFCPTCGQPIDQETESAIPPAPAWPDPPPGAGPRDASPVEPTRPLEVPASPGPDSGATPEGRAAIDQDEPTPAAPVRPVGEPIRPVAERRYEPEPARPVRDESAADAAEDRGAWDEGVVSTPPSPGAAPSPPPMTAGATSQPPPAASGHAPVESGPPPARGPSNVPVSAPVTVSGWLIGGGATIAAVGALVALLDGGRAVVDLLVLLAMAAVAISIFFSSSLPALANLRLATLAIVLIAFGAATDRLLAGVGGVGELLLFLGAAAAVIGALLLELGRDQPLGGS
jgi:hypothetical protein